MNKIIEYINKIEFDMSIKFPPVYKRFLIEEIKDSEAGNDSNLLIVFYVQIMPDDFVMQLHRF